MKYKQNYIRDFNWYLSVRHLFSFDGSLGYDVVYDKKGADARKAFFYWDSMGRLLPTKHPNILISLLRTKGSVNLHIKNFAEDRARGYLPKIIFDEMLIEFNAPSWFEEAVEKQKNRYYP